MPSLILVVLAAVLFSNISIKETNGDMRVYKRYRLNKDKRGVADYPMTSYTSPSYSQPSNSGYSLNSGIQRFAGFGGFGGFGGSVGHGLQFSDSSPSPASGLGYSLGLSPGGGHGLSLGTGSGHGLSLGSGGGHALSLGGLSLGDQSGLLIPTQSKTGPVTFGSTDGGGGGGSASNSAYDSSPHYSGLQGISAFGGGQSGGYNLPLVLGSSRGSGYSFPGSSSIFGSHGLSLSSLGSNGSPTDSNPFSGPGQHGSGGYLIPAASLGSSKYSIPISSGSPGYTLSSSGSLHAGATSYSSPVSSAYTQASAQEASSVSSYAQPISSYSGSNSVSSPYAKYTPASSDGSAYATSDSSNSSPGISYSPESSYSPVSSYSSQGTSYSSPSISYAGSTQTESAGSPTYASSSASYSQSPSTSDSKPSVQYVGASSRYPGSGGYASSYSSPSSSQSSQVETAGAYSTLSARHLSYPATKAVENKESDLSKYDTISYSAPIGL